MKRNSVWFAVCSLFCLVALVGLECLDGYLTRQNQIYYNQFYSLLLVRYGTPCLLGALICLRQIIKQRAGVCQAFWIDLCTLAVCVADCIWWIQSMKYVQGNGCHLLLLSFVFVSLIQSAIRKKRTAKAEK